MNPLSVSDTIMRMVEAITQRDRRQQAAATVAHALTPPPGVVPIAARPRMAPPPVVTQLPNTGAGPGTVAPLPAAAPPPPVVNAVFDQLGSALHQRAEAAAPAAAVGAALASRFVPGNPVAAIHAAGDIPPNVAALDAPRGAVAGMYGEAMFNYVDGKMDAPMEEAFVRNVPFARKLFDWARDNPGLVRKAHQGGFVSRDGGTTYEGGRAVWEAYARENLTGNLPGAATSLAMDPLNLIGGPAKKVGTTLAEEGARLAATGGDNLLRELAGHGLATAGKAVALPDVAYETALGGAGDLLGGGLRAVGNQARKNRVGAQVGRWFEASPRAQAERLLRSTLAARNQVRSAEDRAAAGMGDVIDPNGISPSVPPEAETAAPRTAYEHAPTSSNRTNTTDAAGRAQDRVTTLANAAPNDEVRTQVESIWNGLETIRNDINDTMLRPGDAPTDDVDFRNYANRVQLWQAEFDAEKAGRRVLADAGAELPPYRNIQPRGSMAYHLDVLAWNPDEAAADIARQKIIRQEATWTRRFGEDGEPTAFLRAAREEAEEWRAQGIGETPPTTVAAQEGAPVRAEEVEPHLELLDARYRPAWRTALASANGRATEFMVADVRMRVAHATGEGTEEARQTAERLLESTRRDDDYMEAVASNGHLPPEITDAVLGGGEEHRAASEAVDASFRTGPIVAPEAEADLARTFSENNPTYAGRSYGEVADEFEREVTDDKNQLVQLLAQGTSTLDAKQLAELKQLQAKYPQIRTASEALRMNTDAAFKDRLRAEFHAETGYQGSGRVGRTLDTASRVYSSVNLLMPWTFPRYYLGNLTGDTWQILLTHGPEAVAAANDPRLLRSITDYARKGGDPLIGAGGDLIKSLGLGGLHPEVVSENLAEAIWRKEGATLKRAAGPARFNLVGGIDKATGLVTNPARNIANGLEWTHRTGLYLHLLRTEAINAKPIFAQEMERLGANYGLGPADIRSVMETLPPTVDGAEVADSLGRLAQSRGIDPEKAKGFATEAGRTWQSRVYKADAAAREGVNKALFSFESTNIDDFTRRVVPFHFWMSRAIPFYAEQGLRHPGFAAAYYRTYQATNEAAETEGWPQALRTFKDLGFRGPGGMMLLLNPLSAIGVMDFSIEANGGYTDENLSALGQVLNAPQKVGLGVGLLPWWAGLLNYAGYLGDSPIGLDPIGTHQARRFLGGLVQNAASEGWLAPIGIEAGTLLGKPFEQRLQDLRGAVSAIGMPGASFIPPQDANATAQRDIRNILLRNELKERRMTFNGYLAMAAQADADPTSEAGQTIEEINDAVAAEELDNSAAHKEAVRDWSRSNAIGNVVNAIVPGPKRTRQEEGLGIQSLANSYWNDDGSAVIAGVGSIPDHEPGKLLDARDEDFVRRWEERFGSEYRIGDLKRMQEAALSANTLQNAPPETATVLEQSAAYHSLGSEQEQMLLETYNDIAYARDDASLGSQSSKRRARHPKPLWMSQEDLAALDQDARYALADAWLLEHDPEGHVANLKEMQDLYGETHPEYGTYQTWATDTRKQWGSPGAFRAAAVRANPNYAAFIEDRTRTLRAEGKPVSEITAELDGDTFSLDGYLAYTGMRKSRFDPMPLETGAPLPVASEGAPIDAMGGGGGYGSSGSWSERVTTAIRDTHAVMKATTKFLGTPLDELPPLVRQGMLNDPQWPEELQPPADAWIYDEYKQFYVDQQAAGGDTSIEAFIAATSKNPTDQAPRYESGVWPPVEIGG